MSTAAMNTAKVDFGIWAHLPDAPRRGAVGGPLSGLTFSAKDLYGVEGWPLRGGTEAPLPQVGESSLVLTLLAAGADLTGTTHLHEIALGITGENAFGGTRNPLDPARVAGGSSGGAAASVATREVSFALGTDTGGSVRVPASWCGVAGFKPTYGLYPLGGVLPLSESCDHAGTLARKVATLARAHEVVTGQEVRAASWEGVRVGVWNVRNWVVPEVWAQVTAAERRLSELGTSVAGFEFPDVLDTYTPIVLSEAAHLHRGALSIPEPGFTPRTLSLLRRGAALAPEEVQAARVRRESLRANLAALFEEFDVLLAPAVPDVAPLIGQETVALPEGEVPVRQAALRLTAPWSLLGAPTLALPRPLGELSVGLQLIRPWGQDASLLALAQLLEEDV